MQELERLTYEEPYLPKAKKTRPSVPIIEGIEEISSKYREDV